MAVVIWFCADWVSNTTSPKMIVDPDVTFGYGGIIMNPPVEVTGKDPSQGVTINVCGKVPEEWVKYVKYDENWTEWNPFSPQGKLGMPLLYLSYTVLAVLAIALVYRIIVLYKKGKFNKKGV